MRFVLRKHEIELTYPEVSSIARQISPEPIRRHFVKVDEKEIPPKQLLEAVLKAKGINISRVDFTTMDARSIFRRLGFECKEVKEIPHSLPIETLSQLEGFISIGGDAVKDTEKYNE